MPLFAKKDKEWVLCFSLYLYINVLYLPGRACTDLLYRLDNYLKDSMVYN